MEPKAPLPPALPTGEPPAPTGNQPVVVAPVPAGPVVVDTFAGRVHVEWDNDASVTPLGQMAFFVDFVKVSGLFDRLVADCPVRYTSPNAPKTRDLIGTTFLSVLAGHWRYAHITALRCDTVNPPLLGMTKVVSEDGVRRGYDKIEGDEGDAWLQGHLDYTSRPLLNEPWILDIDTTVKPLYGHQEGAEVSYNPHKPGRPSHSYHCYMMSNLRLVLTVDVAPGNEHTSKHSAPRLWKYLDSLSPEQRPYLIRGDVAFGNDPVMREAERRNQPYLFRLRLTTNVKRTIEREMRKTDWQDAGQGWQGKHSELRLVGWSRPRRVVVLRRQRSERKDPKRDDDQKQLQLGFPMLENGEEGKKWEYAVLVTSLNADVLTLGQLYRDRADCENAFDELKNQWGWLGFSTRDLKRCRLMAGLVALFYNWWNLFVRLADPNHHREAITSRPLLLQAIGRQTRHAGQTRITVTSSHGDHQRAQSALAAIARFFLELRNGAEQLTPLECWYRILSEALKKFLRGRKLTPPRQLLSAEAAGYG